MTHTPRTITTTILIVLTYVLSVTDGSDLILSDDYTIEEQEWIDFASNQFARAELELPDVPITFPAEAAACFGYGGVYVPSEQAVRICRPSKRTVIHELAHAWIETTISDDDRQTFLDMRGLDQWVGGDQWYERGAEQAAEIVTWALLDRNMLMSWIDTHADGTTTHSWRLAKIPDSDPDHLAAAYHQLTGKHPHARIGDDPRQQECTVEVLSPEARRAQSTSGATL